MLPAIRAAVVGDREPLRPRLAALTMVRDEPVMLPRWIAHYTRQCGDPEALLVIDDNSRDGSTDGLPCPVIRIPAEAKRKQFERARIAFVSSIAAGLLNVYDAVLFSDCDEFVVADPAKYPTLVDFLADRRRIPAFGAMGLNVVNHLPSEEPLDPRRPLLAQRSLAKFVPWMCKPGLKRTPARWANASHGLEAPFAIDPDLYMFHAKFADVELLRDVADRRRVLVGTLRRAPQSMWSLGGEAMVQMVEDLTATVDPQAVPFFVPPDHERLAGIVKRDGASFRASGMAQLKAMRRAPWVRVPERFRDSV